MTGFLSSGAMDPSGSTGVLQGTDERLMPEYHRWFTARRAHAPWSDGLLWPSARMMCGDIGTPLTLMGVDAAFDSCWAMPTEEQSGNQVMKKIVGTTRDASGNPLATCIVKGYLTSNDQFLRQLTSDANGYFEFCSEFTGVNHYLVAYKAGAPDVEGTTVNTLVPA